MTVDPKAAEMFAATPVNRLLRSRLVARTADRVEVRAPVRDDTLQEYGVVQGGIVSALADTAAVYLVIPEAMARGRVNGIEFKMNFLRPATLDGGELTAVATALKIGQRIAVCSVEVTQRDRHVAHGTFTYLIEP